MEQYLTRDDLNDDSSSYVYLGYLPVSLQSDFEAMWAEKPNEPQYINTRGGVKETPRNFQNYIHRYKFGGRWHEAIPTAPAIFQQYLDWANAFGGFQYNGILVNWYADGNQDINWHSDSETEVDVDTDGNTQILSISFGQTRRFDFRPIGGKLSHSYDLTDRMIVVMAGRTQQTHQHRLFRSTAKGVAESQGRRINITLRRFK